MQIATGTLVVAISLALPAHADTHIAVENALYRYTTACSSALTDPDAYIASLTLPGPAGEKGSTPPPMAAMCSSTRRRPRGLPTGWSSWI